MTRVPALELADVRVRRGGREVLSIDRLAVEPGEVLAVIGPNGSGKSTLLRAAGLLEAPDAGEIRLFGAPVGPTGTLAARRRITTVFQEPWLADTTVLANATLGLRLRGLSDGEAVARAVSWLERFGIARLAPRRARTLSGGEAQRVALARALAAEPAVLLLDEPFAALDTLARGPLVAEVAGVLRRDRVTTLLVTHDRSETQLLGDRVAVLVEGRVLQVGRPADVFGSPVSEEVARIVGVETVVTGTVIGVDGGLTVVRVGTATIEVAARAREAAELTPKIGSAVRVCIRPEDVTLADPRAPGARDSARNHLAGAVTAIRPAGGQAHVTLDCGFPLVAGLTPRSVAELGLAPGVATVAAFKATAAYLLPARLMPTDETEKARAPVVDK